MARKIILDGDRNICQLGQEEDVGIYAGSDLGVGSLLVDQERRRAYTITNLSPRAIVVSELELERNIFEGDFPLDAPQAVGEITESGSRVLCRRK